MLSKQHERLTAQHIVPGNEGNFGNMKYISKDRQVRAAASCCQSETLTPLPLGRERARIAAARAHFNQRLHASAAIC